MIATALLVTTGAFAQSPMRELLQCNQWNRAGEWLTDRYIQHNPLAASGLAGVKYYFIEIAKRVQTPTTRASHIRPLGSTRGASPTAKRMSTGIRPRCRSRRVHKNRKSLFSPYPLQCPDNAGAGERMRPGITHTHRAVLARLDIGAKPCSTN
jgi:hypothetical protein